MIRQSITIGRGHSAITLTLGDIAEAVARLTPDEWQHVNDLMIDFHTEREERVCNCVSKETLGYHDGSCPVWQPVD